MQGTQEIKLPDNPFNKIEGFESRMQPVETPAGDAQKSETECTKLRSLLKDLTANYGDANKSVEQLQSNIDKLVLEYNTISDEHAKYQGDNSSTSWSNLNQNMKHATLVSSRATAVELQFKNALCSQWRGHESHP
ncbi:unnamed protein product [Symbiodinium sp. CCMP2592]|nr:unnamed protein product [Symbiodinium sp. CCMP2592]